MSKAETYSYFMGSCVTAPIFGTILSGYITRKLGGYESKYVLHSAFVFGLVGIALAIPTPFITN
jgi:hypothetical protein